MYPGSGASAAQPDYSHVIPLAGPGTAGPGQYAPGRQRACAGGHSDDEHPGGEPPDFDAATVAPSSVQFGPGGATIAHTTSHLEDVDGDGDLDLVLHFRIGDAGIACGDDAASLTGRDLRGTTDRRGRFGEDGRV